MHQDHVQAEREIPLSLCGVVGRTSVAAAKKKKPRAAADKQTTHTKEHNQVTVRGTDIIVAQKPNCIIIKNKCETTKFSID